MIYFQPRKSIAGLHTKLKLLMVFLPSHQSEISRCLSGLWFKEYAQLRAYYCLLNIRIPHQKSNPQRDTSLRELCSTSAGTSAFKFSSPGNAICNPMRRVCRRFLFASVSEIQDRKTLLGSSNSAFCQQKTASYSQFPRILLSLLFSTLPDGFQTISFKRLIQSNKFIICAWSVTKTGQSLCACFFPTSY